LPVIFIEQIDQKDQTNEIDEIDALCFVKNKDLTPYQTMEDVTLNYFKGFNQRGRNNEKYYY